MMRAAAIAAVLVAPPREAAAQAAEQAQQIRQQIDQVRREFNDRLTALEAQLAAMQGGQPAPPPQPAAPPAASADDDCRSAARAAGAGGPTGALPVYGAALAGSKVFNPDMAVIGDFLGAAGRNTVNPHPALEMHESEASFQAVVDPYARADFFMSFGEEGVELEEGF